MSMTVGDLMDWSEVLATVLEREYGKPGGDGTTDHRRIVEEEMRRIHG